MAQTATKDNTEPTEELQPQATAPRLPDTTFRPPVDGQQFLPECIAGWVSFPVRNDAKVIAEAMGRGVHITVKGDNILINEAAFETDEYGRLKHIDCVMGVRRAKDAADELAYFTAKARGAMEGGGTLTESTVPLDSLTPS
jgi:hypothetical protein